MSNNCFSPSNSNGRALGNLFYGWQKEDLAQFCVIAKAPAWDVCNNYYCMEDSTMLTAFKHCRKAIGRKLCEPSLKASTTGNNNAANDTQRRNTGRKTLPKVVLRELIWAFKRWKSKDFERWVDDFRPNVVVLQFTDSMFMLDIALSVAKSRNIPLVIYSTEGFYFFDTTWYSHSCADSILFPIYRKVYQKKVRRLMAYASHTAYCNSQLKEDYDGEFHKPSSVVYISSNLQASAPPQFNESIPSVNYLGNLGLDRDSALIDVAETLRSIDERFRINVYGPANEEVAKRLREAEGIEYHGLVSYDKVKEVIAHSDILLHVESERGHKERHLQYAFSGKIADTISSGKCFVLYAPKEVACAKYVIESGAGWYAGTKNELKDVFLRILNNLEERNAVLAKAKEVAAQNHNFERNAQMFQNILLNA